MSSEFEEIRKTITQATCPEDVFGSLDGDPANNLKVVYRRMARITHPDMHPDLTEKLLAQQAFQSLSDWLKQAEQKVAAGSYGRKTELQLDSGRRVYTLSGSYTTLGIYNAYACRWDEKGKARTGLLQAVRDPRENDRAWSEARNLEVLRAGEDFDHFAAYFSELVESFQIDENGLSRVANVFACETGWYTLKEVHHVYPDGIDPKDMAWMWRRLLTAIGYAQRCGLTHGALLPDNIAILPDQHGLRLRNWTATEGITDVAYLDWFPPEMQRGDPPSPGADIYIAAQCMIYLLGGDPASGRMPGQTPGALQGFLKGCRLPGVKSRPQDAWALLAEFDELLQRLWGERKFHPFYMK